MAYRTVRDIKPAELLAALTPKPQFQIELFVKLGGDPDDHHYAYLSYLTAELRKQGHPVKSDRRRGVWIEP